MKHVILSAKYANPDHTSAILQTMEDGAVAVSVTDTPDLWRNMLLAVTAEPFSVPFEPGAVKLECQRRIYAVVDQIAQVNLAAAAAGSVLDESQMAVYRSGLVWIASMRTTCAQLINASEQAFVEDRHWPDPDLTIVALAKKF